MNKPVGCGKQLAARRIPWERKDPPDTLETGRVRGVVAPVTIVFACGLDVESYARLEQDIKIDRPVCPTCAVAMTWWSWYRG